MILSLGFAEGMATSTELAFPGDTGKGQGKW